MNCVLVKEGPFRFSFPPDLTSTAGVLIPVTVPAPFRVSSALSETTSGFACSSKVRFPVTVSSCCPEVKAVALVTRSSQVVIPCAEAGIVEPIAAITARVARDAKN